MNTINCPNCGAEAPVGSAFCDSCGNSLAGVAARPGPGSGAGFGSPAGGFGSGPAGGFGGQQRCPGCGESVMPGEAFCGNCGTPLSTSAPTAFVPPPPVSSAPSWSPPPPPPAPSWPSSPPALPPSPSWPSSPPAPADSWPSSPPAPQSWGAPPAPQPAGSLCPNCSSPIQPSDVFCDNCGHALTPGSGFPSEPQIPVKFESDPHLPMPMTPPEPPAPVIPVLSPRLVVQASGATLNLTPGKNEYLIGREDPVSGSFPDVDLVPYGGEEGGVSRRHAQILRRGGQFSIEDLNSVNYTFVNRQKVAPGTPHPLQDGDEVRLGRVVLQFKTN